MTELVVIRKYINYLNSEYRKITKRRLTALQITVYIIYNKTKNILTVGTPGRVEGGLPPHPVDLVFI